MASITRTSRLIRGFTVDAGTIIKIDDVHSSPFDAGDHPFREPFVDIIVFNEKAPRIVGSIYICFHSGHFQEEATFAENPLMMEYRGMIPRRTHIPGFVGKQIMSIIDCLFDGQHMPILNIPSYKRQMGILGLSANTCPIGLLHPKGKSEG